VDVEKGNLVVRYAIGVGFQVHVHGGIRMNESAFIVAIVGKDDKMLIEQLSEIPDGGVVIHRSYPTHSPRSHTAFGDLKRRQRFQ
jgi:hypothetical protein